MRSFIETLSGQIKSVPSLTSSNRNISFYGLLDASYKSLYSNLYSVVFLSSKHGMNLVPIFNLILEML